MPKLLQGRTRQLRLAGGRRTLLSPAPQASAGGARLAWGFSAGYHAFPSVRGLTSCLERWRSPQAVLRPWRSGFGGWGRGKHPEVGWKGKGRCPSKWLMAARNPRPYALAAPGCWAADRVLTITAAYWAYDSQQASLPGQSACVMENKKATRFRWPFTAHASLSLEGN